MHNLDLSQLATSSDIENINKEIVESVKSHRTNINLKAEYPDSRRTTEK